MCVIYYEETKRELKRILIYECRCDERLKPKVYPSKLSSDTVGSSGDWYTLKIETRLMDGRFESVKSECVM
jgi:hypothetical protein